MKFEVAEEVRALDSYRSVIQTASEDFESVDMRTDITMTPVYLLPSLALQFKTEAEQAWYCLLIAALIDGMTLILAASLRKREPVWNRKWVVKPDFEELQTQIVSCVPEDVSLKEYKEQFLIKFHVDESTFRRGFSMQARCEELAGFDMLIAILCDSAHASLQDGILYLRADIVYWFNGQEQEVATV